ncbi:hypothetical protein [Pedobacter sp. KBS0701]|uniref:hypothetical protein n=1 Tax=Pedobacter sp. KBS0701 TaxID=2578106 RepID=UPI001FEE9403|nr:hypothetical protein [Pedobacter sp. KBS0701]
MSKDFFPSSIYPHRLFFNRHPSASQIRILIIFTGMEIFEMIENRFTNTVTADFFQALSQFNYIHICINDDKERK